MSQGFRVISEGLNTASRAGGISLGYGTAKEPLVEQFSKHFLDILNRIANIATNLLYLKGYF
jgi:hypothetical protein